MSRKGSGNAALADPRREAQEIIRSSQALRLRAEGVIAALIAALLEGTLDECVADAVDGLLYTELKALGLEASVLCGPAFCSPKPSGSERLRERS